MSKVDRPNAPYDPTVAEPTTLGELATWFGYMMAFKAGKTIGNAPKLLSRRTDSLLELSKTKYQTDSWTEAFRKLRADYILATGITTPLEEVKLDDVISFFKKQASSPVPLAKPTGQEAGTIWFHAERQYSIDRETPLKVSEEIDSILQAFLESQAAMETYEIEKKSGVTNPSRAMQTLAEWNDGIFKAAVRIPTAKAKGGYFVRIKPL